MVYPGGKNASGVYQKIINLMPPHDVYIEPFLGGGAIFRTKLPARVANIGIDADAEAVASCERIIHQDESKIPNCIILNGDALSYLSGWEYTQWFGPKTMVYLDPPYVMSTRSSQRRYYKYEMTDEQHIQLLDIILELPCMVMISGYYSDLYAARLSNWRVETFQAQTRSGKTATEYVWCNFPEPFELHDYRFLGGNFRERERIHKRQRRWKARLEKMDSLERFSILSVIQELSSCSNTGSDEAAGIITNNDVVTR